MATASGRGPTAITRVRFDVPVAIVTLTAIGYLAAELVSHASPAETWAPPVALGVQAAVLRARRLAPAAVLVAVSVLDAALLATSGGELGIGALAGLFAAYTVRAQLPRNRAYAWLAVVAAAMAASEAVALAFGSLPAGAWLVPLAIARALVSYGTPVAVFEIVAARRNFVTALRERAELAEQAREYAAEDALRRERAMMARELHDVAAHHLTGIIVSTQAARALLHDDPAATENYLATAERETRTALDNIRQAVGLLRTDRGTDYEPAPSLDSVGALIAGFPGIQARLEVVGSPIDLGPLAQLAAYRMIEESLTNAAAHAPGSTARVEIRYSPDAVRITVTNTAALMEPAPRTAGGGHGLIGMRERAGLLHGSLTTEPTEDGGWRNTLTIPAPDAAPTEPQIEEVPR